MRRFKFDAEKAIEVLLYISQQTTNLYNALKVLYFADKQHLAKYGRFICGDSYVALQYGPVPDYTYNLAKLVRGDGWMPYCDVGTEAKSAFRVGQRTIEPLREPNLDFLSESDIECLNAAIQQYAHLTFNQLHHLSSDEAYHNADENGEISLESIATTLPNSEGLIEYLNL